MKFCIDRDEHASSSLPDVRVSFRGATQTCASASKRLCRESEWTFACEGEAMLPYPTGVERPSNVCNLDRVATLDANGKIRDLRMASKDLDACTSPFGARNMTGNVDEWTIRDLTPGPFVSALKGGWWAPGRNRCRPATVLHDEIYADFQTGFRCCADVR
jgi:formylglycine-generating enzyme required for sulfatase activity